MSDKPRTFRVMVTRTGYRHGNITVTAVSEADALRKAREQAGNHDFSAEHAAEYTFDEDSIEEIIVEEPARKKDNPSIETMMRIAEDTKKRISFIKAAGKWAWGSRWRGDRERGPLNTDRLFDTFEEALRDAVEPYLNEETE